MIVQPGVIIARKERHEGGSSNVSAATMRTAAWLGRLGVFVLPLDDTALISEGLRLGSGLPAITGSFVKEHNPVVSCHALGASLHQRDNLGLVLP